MTFGSHDGRDGEHTGVGFVKCYFESESENIMGSLWSWTHKVGILQTAAIRDFHQVPHLPYLAQCQVLTFTMPPQI